MFNPLPIFSFMSQSLRFSNPGRHLLPTLFSSLILLSLAACGGGGSSAPAPVAPSVNAAPQSQSVSVGNAVQLSVQAGGSTPISYQWQRNGVDIPGATSASYTLGHATLADSNAEYRVLLKNAAGTTASAGAILKVSGVELFAGSLSETGNVDGASGQARFNGAGGLAIDLAGNLFVADGHNAAVRKISKDGVVSTMGGRQNGVTGPTGISVDSAGNAYYSSGDIWKLTPSGVVSRVTVIPYGVGDSRSSAIFVATGVGVDGQGNVYAANDVGTRKVAPDGSVTIVYGQDVVNGASGTRILTYHGITNDRQGNVYYGTAEGIVRAGADGSVRTVLPNYAGGWLATDGAGNFYTLSSYGSTVTKIAADGKETVVAGVAGSTATQAGALPGSFASPQGLAVDAQGFIYVSSGGSAIMKIGLP